MKNLLLAFFLTLATLPLFAQDAKIPEFETPDWAQAQIDDVQKRIAAWAGDDETVIFPLISDLHSGIPEFQDPVNIRDSKVHAVMLLRAAKQLNADFVADLGDMGFDRDTSWVASTLEHAEKRLQSQVALYKSTDLPVIFCMGNHDDGSANGHSRSEKRLSTKEFGEMFTGQTIAKGYKLTCGPNQDWGFFDLPEKKFRVFFMNTCDEGKYGFFSKAQLQFLADGLKLPEGWCAVTLEHICLHPTIGCWLPSRKHSMGNDQIYVQILEDFVKNAKGELDGVSWDFTGNRNTGLAGTISGDSHFDAQDTVEGVNYVITQSYGTIHPNNLSENGRNLRFDRSREMLCDVVVVKPAKRVMRFFRLGAGGPECDREFKF